MEDDLRTVTPYRISCLRQQPSGVDRRCQIWPISRVYQILVYRHELFKINFTGVPSSSPPVSPRFFPALSHALFLAGPPLSERLEQAMTISTDRQHDGYCLYQQQKGNTFSSTCQLSPRAVGVVSGKRHLCDSHSHPRKRHRLCRQGVENIQGCEHVEVQSNYHPTLSKELSDRPVCNSPDHLAQGLYQLETRPRLHPHRCRYIKLGSPKGVRLSTVQSNRQKSRESDDRQGRAISCYPSLASPTLMASPLKTCSFTASATPGMLMYDVMVKYIVSLGKNSFLTLQIISMKLVTLFPLTCPERISALATLDLRLCSVHPEGVSFRFSTPRKSGSADKPAEGLFARFVQDIKPCPVECFRHYLKLTRNVRPVFLLLNLTRCLSQSYVPTSLSLLRYWDAGLRTFMKAAGIDSQMFKAHSVRGASTTAATNAFVPLSTIMSMAY